MKNKYNLYLLGIAICLSAIVLPGSSQAIDAATTINLIINPDLPASPTTEQVTSARNDMMNIYNMLNTRKLTATIYLTQDVASSDISLFLAQLSLYTDFEFAMSGSNSDENLSTRSYSDQLSILEMAKSKTESCGVCGKKQIMVTGFRPQNYDQNEDTYKALDELGIVYDAGFKAGVLFTQGHEKDVWPYKVENHNFYAVPVSTFDVSGKKVTLDDALAMESGMSSAQWYDVLKGKFDEASSGDEPIVISLRTSVSRSEDFLKALQDFLDYAVSKNASFVTTMNLVNTTLTENYVPPASSGCKTCGASKKENVTIIAQNNTTIEKKFDFTPTMQNA